MTKTKKRIITHNGCLHCDEVTAYTLLNEIYPSELVRTRAKDILEKGKNDPDTFIIDVGGIYDHKLQSYDHHQKTFDESFNKEGSSINMSSAGLVWKHYGKDYLMQYLDTINLDIQSCYKKVNDYVKDFDYSEYINKVHEKIYSLMFKEIDGIDNGVLPCDPKHVTYNINTNISSIVSKMNNENIYDAPKQLECFKKASNYVKIVLQTIVQNTALNEINYMRDYNIISAAYNKAINNNNKYIYVKEDVVQWQKCLFNCETDDKKILFCIYETQPILDPKTKLFSPIEYRIKAISVDFKNRCSLLSMEELDAVVDVPEDIIFVHEKRFIGSAKSLATAISMVNHSIAAFSEQ